MRNCPSQIPAVLALAALSLGLFAATAVAGDLEASPAARLDLQLYGLSYHTDREGVRRNGLDNELNVGLGLHYVLHEDQRAVQFIEAGFYRDSGRHEAKVAGIGYQYKLGQHWRLGGALVGVQSQTYNRGNAFVAPLPIVTYDFGAVKLNAVYAPRYKDYNQFAVIGFYLSVPLGR